MIILEILRCQTHRRFYAVAINDYRISPSKCCGSWNTVAKWNLHSRRFVADTKRAFKSHVKARKVKQSK